MKIQNFQKKSTNKLPENGSMSLKNQQFMERPQYIGGFFELEQAGDGSNYHTDAIALSTGRACLSFILDEIKPGKVHVPFYACNTLYEPMKGRCDCSYYSIDEKFELKFLPDLKQDEYLLYINYFGLKGTYIEELKRIFGSKLIIDDVHNFFRKGHHGHWSFCSARKYFGVPDGAYLYATKSIDLQLERNQAIQMDHLVNRSNGKQELAFAQFQEYENSLICEKKLISTTSENLLNNIDYNFVRNARRTNFSYLDSELSGINILSITLGQSDPFCYPVILEKSIPKSTFHKCDIFIPTFWPDILQRENIGFLIEKDFARKLIPVPIDHRYQPVDLKRVINLIKEKLTV